MKNVILLLLISLLFNGCASMEQQGSSNNVQTKSEGYIGFAPIETEKGIKILFVGPNAPASEAGLMPDDIIKNINDYPIQNYTQCISVIRAFKPTSKAEFTIERNGKIINIHLTPIQRKVPIDIDVCANRVVTDLLGRNKKVSLLIIVGEISNADPNYKENEGWEKGMRNTMQSWLEKNYLPNTLYPNFHLVDRNKTDEILKELKFSLTGAISDDFRAQVGKMTGATYILHVTISRFPTNKINHYKDTTTERLISVETGDVVGSDSFTNDIGE
jgi:membrane-associated protease RseP (regulator of RpoE activity)